MDNTVSGNARVTVQGTVNGSINVNGGQVSVNGFRANGDGTYTVDGAKVGAPRRSACGCPGNDTWHYVNGVRVCSRCNRRI